VGINSGIYKALLVLHILAAIVGFGSVMLNALYGLQARKRRGAEGLAIVEANFFVTTKAAVKAIYLVFVFGVLLVLTSDDIWSFGDLWISLSMGLYVLAMGLSHGVLLPNVERMQALMGELIAMGPPPPQGATAGPPPQAVELERRGKTVGMVGAVNNLVVVTVLTLMIWKPT
jgi:uncharacterized membrane protein